MPPNAPTTEMRHAIRELCLNHGKIITYLIGDRPDRATLLAEAEQAMMAVIREWRNPRTGGHDVAR